MPFATIALAGLLACEAAAVTEFGDAKHCGGAEELSNDGAAEMSHINVEGQLGGTRLLESNDGRTLRIPPAGLKKQWMFLLFSSSLNGFGLILILVSAADQWHKVPLGVGLMLVLLGTAFAIGAVRCARWHASIHFGDSKLTFVETGLWTSRREFEKESIAKCFLCETPEKINETAMQAIDLIDSSGAMTRWFAGASPQVLEQMVHRVNAYLPGSSEFDHVDSASELLAYPRTTARFLVALIPSAILLGVAYLITLADPVITVYLERDLEREQVNARFVRRLIIVPYTSHSLPDVRDVSTRRISSQDSVLTLHTPEGSYTIPGSESMASEIRVFLSDESRRTHSFWSGGLGVLGVSIFGGLGLMILAYTITWWSRPLFPWGKDIQQVKFAQLHQVLKEKPRFPISVFCVCTVLDWRPKQTVHLVHGNPPSWFVSAFMFGAVLGLLPVWFVGNVIAREFELTLIGEPWSYIWPAIPGGLFGLLFIYIRAPSRSFFADKPTDMLKWKYGFLRGSSQWSDVRSVVLTPIQEVKKGGVETYRGRVHIQLGTDALIPVIDHGSDLAVDKKSVLNLIRPIGNGLAECLNVSLKTGPVHKEPSFFGQLWEQSKLVFLLVCAALIGLPTSLFLLTVVHSFQDAANRNQLRNYCEVIELSTYERHGEMMLSDGLLLDFEGRETTDEELSQAADLISRLEENLVINLFGASITADGLKHLGNNNQITALILRSSTVNDDALKVVATMDGLRQLNLLYAPVTDDGLHQLAELRRLTVLSIGSRTGTHITDASLEHLQQIRSLRHVFLQSTTVTPEAAKSLEQANPKLKLRIEYDHLNRDALRRKGEF